MINYSEIKKIWPYILSISLISFSLGLFLLVFNLHISHIISSRVFLSNFLLLGNVSMAVGSIFFGRLCSKFGLRRLLILATVCCAVSFVLECVLINPIFLYGVSAVYGLGFSVLMSIHVPYIMANVEENRQAYMLSLCTSCRLLFSMLGTLAGGIIPLKTFLPVNNSPYQMVLVLAGAVYLLSCIPLFFVKGNGEKISEGKLKKGEKMKIGFPSFSLIFLLLGLLIFFSPYMNLYLAKRYNLELQTISIVITLVEVSPIVGNLILANLHKKFSQDKIIFTGTLLCAISFGLLAAINNVWGQIVFLLVSTVLASFLFPLINRYLLSMVQKDEMEKASGYANFFYNIGDSLGTYAEGVCIGFGLYRGPFVAAAGMYLLIFALIRGKKNKTHLLQH